MNKQNVLIGLLLMLLLSCQESKRDNFTMEMPDTKEHIFSIEEDLSPDLKDEKIVFERYYKNMLGSDNADRIYANGDYYKSYTKKNNLFWEYIGVISPTGLKKLEVISNTSVIDYILEGPDPNHVENGAAQYISWYFYFDQPKFVETQIRMFQWQWWVQPRFVKQVDGRIKQYLKYNEILSSSERFKEEACN